ncbi:MFS transporter [Aggregicoccus sp. 17bor-14]|uniref:MDR family MFS transporter n=1 Tax=Myxococcaceae TaxID=31 RepID=UPI00129C3195|nr:MULTISPECIES: MFS transporter [Myxococcaceae]MBF5041937.1 MFS transporter [Simulacricoccus sp. 17bor-14]MRI87718.1 MFS transporter [Aggregicoccus sp. 17bor-14]
MAPAPSRLRATFHAHAGGLPRLYWVLWWGTFINRLGSFAVPFIALYLTRERGMGAAAVGLVASLHGLGGLLAAYLGGALADRIGRRPTLIGALCCGAGSMVLLALARQPALIALAAFSLGLLGDMYRPAVSAAIADVVPADRRAQAFTLFYWVVNLGFAVALPTAGLLSRAGFSVLFFADATTTLLYAAVVWRLLPETRPRQAAAAARGGLRSVLLTLAPFRDRAFLAFALPVFLLVIVFFQHMVALPLTLEARGMSDTAWGLVLGTNGALIVLLQPFAGRWVERLPRGAVLAGACVLTGAGFGLHGLSGGVALAVLAVAVWTAGEIMHAPVASSVVADLAPPAVRGTYQGAYFMLWGLAAFLGPLLGGWVLGHAPASALWAGCLALGLLAAALQAGAAAVRRRQLAALRQVRPDISAALD